MQIFLFLIIFGIFSPKFALSANCDGTGPFSFLAIGDTPYDTKGLITLRSTLNFADSDESILFATHIGDLIEQPPGPNDPSTPGTGFSKPQDLLDRFYLFTNFSKPVVIVPGDNETNDQKDPESALQFFRDNFLSLAHKNDLLKIRRQYEHIENLYFYCKGVLFIGVNLMPKGRRNQNNWARTNKASKVWLQYHLIAALETKKPIDPKGIVLFMQQDLKYFPDILTSAKDILKVLGKPTLIIHGDSHQPNFTSYPKIAVNVNRLEVFADPRMAYKVNITPTEEQSIKFSVEIKSNKL